MAPGYIQKNLVLRVQMQIGLPISHFKVLLLRLLIAALLVPHTWKMLQCGHQFDWTEPEKKQLPLAKATVHTSDGNLAAHNNE